jgi:hypothetical protein
MINRKGRGERKGRRRKEYFTTNDTDHTNKREYDLMSSSVVSVWPVVN